MPTAPFLADVPLFSTPKKGRTFIFYMRIDQGFQPVPPLFNTVNQISPIEEVIYKIIR